MVVVIKVLNNNFKVSGYQLESLKQTKPDYYKAVIFYIWLDGMQDKGFK
jgi:hypothetical protein